jgi:hypothetical protein
MVNGGEASLLGPTRIQPSVKQEDTQGESQCDKRPGPTHPRVHPRSAERSFSKHLGRKGLFEVGVNECASQDDAKP